jgi:hypothetical protein
MRISLMFLAILSLFTLVSCASQPMVLGIETPGPLSEVHKTSASTTTPEGTTTRSSQESNELTPAMAELKLKLAKLQAEVEQVRANPCGGWNPPAWCVSGGYNNGYQSYSNGGYVQPYTAPTRFGTAYGTNITYQTH